MSYRIPSERERERGRASPLLRNIDDRLFASSRQMSVNFVRLSVFRFRFQFPVFSFPFSEFCCSCSCSCSLSLSVSVAVSGFRFEFSAAAAIKIESIMILTLPASHINWNTTHTSVAASSADPKISWNRLLDNK